MDIVTVTGIAASVFTSVSMIPQLITLLRLKEATGISYFSLVVLITGLSGWIVYGILREDAIIVAANAFACLINGTNLVLAVKYRNKGKTVH